MRCLKSFCLLICLFMGFNLAAVLSTDWFSAYGGAGNEEATASCFDSAGNFYVAGNFLGTLTIGSQTLATITHTVVFVAKFNPAGQFLWAKQSVGSSNNTCVTYLKSICADDSGNVFICGEFKNKMGFSIAGATALSSPNTNDIFVAKMNASGTFIWAKQAGAGGVDDIANSICLSADRNPVLCGNFSGFANLFGTSVNSAGSSDVFVAKLSFSDGSRLQLSTFGGIAADAATSICAISPDSYAICGYYTGSIAFGSTILNKVGKEAYISLLNSNLAPQWARSSEGIGTQEGDTVAATSSNIFLCGRYSNAVSFDSSISALPNIGNALYAAKLDLSGNYILVKSLGAASFGSRGWASYVNANAELCLAGSFSNSFGTLTSAGSSDGFVLKLNSGGDVLWSQSLGGTEADVASGICGNSSAQMLCVGYYNAGSPLLIGNTPANNGLKDIYAMLFRELSADTPASPQNLSLDWLGAVLQLSWDAVTLSESGIPLSISGYRVYYSPTLTDEDFQLLGQCEGTSFDLSGTELNNDVRFYKVKAFR